MYIPPSVWAHYEAIINNFLNTDAGVQDITWLARLPVLPLFGEDGGENYSIRTLKGLVNYNYIRVWPYNVPTPSGELDTTNVAVYLTKKSLDDGGYLNEKGYWKFDQVRDKFLIDGKMYRPSGETPVAQAKDHAMLFMVILETEDIGEAERIKNKYNLP